jgi:hypothetical protein
VIALRDATAPPAPSVCGSVAGSVSRRAPIRSIRVPEAGGMADPAGATGMVEGADKTGSIRSVRPVV